MEKENPANTEEQELTTSDEQLLTPYTLPPATTVEQTVTTHKPPPNTTDLQLLTPDTPPPNTTVEQALSPDTPPPNTADEQTVTPVTLQRPNTTDEQALNPETPPPNATDEQAAMAHASSSNTTGEQALTTNTLSTTTSNAFAQAISRILTGRVIVEVCTLEQARTAASAGACCVCVTPPPSTATAISYMPDPSLVRDIKRQLSILVMAKVRAGHSAEAQFLETLGIDFIDESETLGIADESHFINKHDFETPFVSGCCDLGQALNRIQEGVVLLRCQGSRRRSLAEAVKSVRKVTGDFARLISMDEDELFAFAERIEAPYDAVARTKQMARLPGLLLASGGIQTPADAALMMKLGCHGVFIGVEVFGYGDATHEKLRSIVLDIGPIWVIRPNSVLIKSKYLWSLKFEIDFGFEIYTSSR